MSIGLFQFQFYIPPIDLDFDRLGAFATVTGRRFVQLSEALRSRRSPWAEDVARRGGTSNQALQPVRPRGAPHPGDAGPAATTGGGAQGAVAPGHPATTSGGKPPEEVQDKKPMRLKDRLKLVLKSGGANKPRCVACDEPVKPSKLVVAPCGHQYCRPCTREIVNVAFKDRSMFPLRCCGQEIPAKQVAPALNPRGRRVYIARAFEHATPQAERWYCPSANCRAWISPRYIRSGAKSQKCPYCRATICPQCRDLAHGQRQCTHDPGLGEILDMARRRHWQRCYNCHSLVERNRGCPHIVCKCGAEFCYMCGRQWATCSCRPRDDDALNDPAWGEEGGLDPAVVVAAMQQADEENAAEAVHATV
ncbi:IBR domain protein [Penicillium cataractarum]|uniref:RBR-type E3 ubiquitin transferase n=1 Tax=Penicillium cataractarum TaxID=2100454 RepID=A0A9W9VUH0_9EURO|nr:IBR domain protein [Penicillium cataractarum]KAJ5389369.1 IBR domain protein [Penicillium cataractarum]